MPGLQKLSVGAGVIIENDWRPHYLKRLSSKRKSSD